VTDGLQPTWVLHSRSKGETEWRQVVSRPAFTDQKFAEHIAECEMNEWPGLEFRAIEYVPAQSGSAEKGGSDDQ
jgi:hypothetical protein